MALQEIFSSVTTHWQLLLGLTIILLVIFLPGGLSSVGRRFRQLGVTRRADSDRSENAHSHNRHFRAAHACSFSGLEAAIYAVS